MSNTESGSPPHAAREISTALAEGRLFGGRYRVVRHIATGGMGSVYEVVHVETDRRRALKVMHPHLFQSDEMRDRFKREARIAAQVESEYIVDVSDAGVDEATGTPFLVMELLQGEELGDRIERFGPLSPTEVMACLQQVGLALDKTHSRMIVHRDLKPENLFLTRREDGSLRVKILDFGVAKLVREQATGAGATRSLGTPLYMAPEQFRTGEKLLPAADIYALGMMAYTLLAGEPYWAPEANAAGDVIAFAMTAVQGPKESAVKRAAARGVTLPRAFDGWFAHVTAVRPSDRFPSASEAVRALGDALGIRPGVGTGTQILPSAAAFALGAVPSSRHETPATALLSGRTTPLSPRIPTSTEAAVGSIPAPRPRSRVLAITGIAAASLGILAVLLRVGTGGVSGGGREDAGPAAAGSGDTAATPASTAPETPAPGTAESVGSSAPAEPAPAPTPAETSAPPPAVTGSLSAAKSARPPAPPGTKPSAPPRAKPAAKPPKSAATPAAATPATTPTTPSSPAPTPAPTSLIGRD